MIWSMSMSRSWARSSPKRRLAMLGRTVGNRNCHADKVQNGAAGTVILCTGTTSCTPPSTGTRVAYSALLADERKETAAAF